MGREFSERRAKTRRDSEPTPDPDKPVGETEEAGPGSEDKENTKPSKFGSLFESLTCGQCGAGFANLVEYIAHKKVCIPDEDFSVGGKQEPKTAPREKTESKCDKPESAVENTREANLARDKDLE